MGVSFSIVSFGLAGVAVTWILLFGLESRNARRNLWQSQHLRRKGRWPAACDSYSGIGLTVGK
jgi:hypothetical protein